MKTACRRMEDAAPAIIKLGVGGSWPVLLGVLQRNPKSERDPARVCAKGIRKLASFGKFTLPDSRAPSPGRGRS